MISLLAFNYAYSKPAAEGPRTMTNKIVAYQDYVDITFQKIKKDFVLNLPETYTPNTQRKTEYPPVHEVLSLPKN